MRQRACAAIGAAVPAVRPGTEALLPRRLEGGDDAVMTGVGGGSVLHIPRARFCGNQRRQWVGTHWRNRQGLSIPAAKQTYSGNSFSHAAQRWQERHCIHKASCGHVHVTHADGRQRRACRQQIL